MGFGSFSGGDTTANQANQQANDQGKNVRGNNNRLLEPGSVNVDQSGNKGVLGSGYQFSNVKGNITIAPVADQSGLTAGLGTIAAALTGLSAVSPSQAFPSSAITPLVTNSTGDTPASSASSGAASSGLSIWWIVGAAAALVTLLLLIRK